MRLSSICQQIYVLVLNKAYAACIEAYSHNSYDTAAVGTKVSACDCHLYIYVILILYVRFNPFLHCYVLIASTPDATTLYFLPFAFWLLWLPHVFLFKELLEYIIALRLHNTTDRCIFVFVMNAKNRSIPTKFRILAAIKHLLYSQQPNSFRAHYAWFARNV